MLAWPRAQNIRPTMTESRGSRSCAAVCMLAKLTDKIRATRLPVVRDRSTVLQGERRRQRKVNAQVTVSELAISVTHTGDTELQ